MNDNKSQISNMMYADKEFKNAILSKLDNIISNYSAFVSKNDNTDIKSDDIKNTSEYQSRVLDALNKVCDIAASILEVNRTLLNSKDSDSNKLSEVLLPSFNEIKESLDKNANKVEVAVGDVGKLQDKMITVSAKGSNDVITMMKQQDKTAKEAAKNADFKQGILNKKSESKKIIEPVKAEKTKKRGKFDLSKIFKGLSGLLKSFLNPITWIMEIISKLLPYVLIFGAMLYGAWQGMGEELREKIVDVGKTILKYAIIGFGVFKTVLFAKRALEIKFQIWRKARALTKYLEEMKIIRTERSNNASINRAKRANLAMDRTLSKQSFILTKAGILFKKVLDIAVSVVQMTAAWAGVALLGIAVVALVAGIIYVFVKLSKEILGIMTPIFKFIGDVVGKFIDKMVEVGKSILNGIVGAVTTFLKWLFGGKKEPSEDKKQTQKTQQFKSELSKHINDIIEPIKSVTDAINNTLAPKLTNIEQAIKSVVIDGGSNNSSIIRTAHFDSTTKAEVLPIDNAKNTMIDSMMRPNGFNMINALMDNKNSKEIISWLETINKNISNIIENQIAMKRNVGSLHTPVQRS